MPRLKRFNVMLRTFKQLFPDPPDIPHDERPELPHNHTAAPVFVTQSPIWLMYGGKYSTCVVQFRFDCKFVDLKMFDFFTTPPVLLLRLFEGVKYVF